MITLLDMLDRTKFFLTKRAAYSTPRSLKFPNGVEVLFPLNSDVYSLNLSAVWNALTIISGHLALMPLSPYERLEGGGSKEATDHPLYSVLKYKPNPYMTAFNWRQAVSVNIELSGVSYNYVYRPSYREIQIYPLISSQTSKHKNDKGGYFYRTRLNEEQFEIPEESVFRIIGMSFDGRAPINPMLKRSRSINLMNRIEDQAQSYFDNSANLTGLIKLPDKNPTDEYLKQFKQRWRQTYEGMKNEHKTGLLYGGAEFKELHFTAEQVQMLASRKFTPVEVARWFNIPVNKLKDMERATYNNIEHMEIEYLMDSLLPRTTNIETSLAFYFFAPEELEKYFFKHNFKALLRADTKSQMEALEIQFRNAIISPNEWRGYTDMNPDPDPSADKKFLPLNMIPRDQSASYFLEDQGGGDDNGDRSGRPRIQVRGVLRARALNRRVITNAYAPIFRKSAEAIVGQEVKDIREKAAELLGEKGNSIGFNEFLDEYYDQAAAGIQERIRQFIDSFGEDMVSAALEEIGSDIDIDVEKFKASYAESGGKRWAASSRRQLQELVKEAARDQEDLLEAVEDRLIEWEEKRAAKYERNEPIRAESAFSKSAWMSAGVGKIAWATNGKSCPFCASMDGVIIGITGTFLSAGQELAPEGSEPLVPSTNIGHPGLHDGCDCSIVPVT